MKIFYFLSESLLNELSNINHFISKSILTKSILSKIDFVKVEPNTLIIVEMLELGVQIELKNYKFEK